jgi:hypothetical protein
MINEARAMARMSLANRGSKILWASRKTDMPANKNNPVMTAAVIEKARAI